MPFISRRDLFALIVFLGLGLLIFLELIALTLELQWFGVDLFDRGKEQDRELLEDVGRRLSIPPTRDDAANYLMNSIHLGMTRSQVYEQAELW